MVSLILAGITRCHTAIETVSEITLSSVCIRKQDLRRSDLGSVRGFM